jgi:hypothetical protein
MMPETPHESLFRLMPRDRQIIEQVIRDRIATNEAIQRRFFTASHPTSVTRATARLCAAGWLADFPLVYPTKYFVPGKLATAAYGLSANRCCPLGPQALPTEYAVLEYTTANADHVQRLTLDELQAVSTWYRPQWMLAPHCRRQTDGKPALELVRVDLGGPADHIARKCRQDILTRQIEPEFDALVADGRFAMVIVTGSTSKSAAIHAALDQQVWPQGLTFRISVFPTLIPILPRSL